MPRPAVSSRTCDFLIIGGGVVGLTIALEARRRHPAARLVLIEKEPACGQHASGRNSGVLHAGFYYSRDSLKARFTQQGNRRLTDYCEERGLSVSRCGKLVVARDEADLAGLDELAARGRANGVELQELSAAEAHRIEPAARTYERALFSPATVSVEPAEVMASLTRDVQTAGVDIRTDTPYLGRTRAGISTPGGELQAGYVINAAGLYADRIARDYGFSEHHRILPFKGLYLYGGGSAPPLRTHIYPVPELRYPFLGVHFTLTARGQVKIGPTAVPALWREQYRGLERFRARELFEIVGRESALLATNAFGFRSMAVREARKYSRRWLVRLAQTLVHTPLAARDWKWGPPGIRAQLYDTSTRKLEMDFCVQSDDRSCHVLNAVSPAFTSAFPFASYVFDRVDGVARDTGGLSLPVAAEG